MRDLRFLLKTHYAGSHALIVGINQYEKASPLSYAVNDALEIKNILAHDFGFPLENISYLTDAAATKSAILKAFFRFTKDEVGLDDRVLVFFAGHGHTLTGSRGEIGYLVPYDADMSDYSTLIRWDDLTRNSELIRSKHVLFIMDACYGGLALMRHAQPGSTRFLKDMGLRKGVGSLFSCCSRSPARPQRRFHPKPPRQPAYPGFLAEGAASFHTQPERLQFRRAVGTIHSRHPGPWLFHGPVTEPGCQLGLPQFPSPDARTASLPSV